MRSASIIARLFLTFGCVSLFVLPLLAAQAPSADFDGSGSVEFADFVAFAGVFGTSERTFDLTGDGNVDFADFLVFAEAYGASNSVPTEPEPAPPLQASQ